MAKDRPIFTDPSAFRGTVPSVRVPQSSGVPQALGGLLGRLADLQTTLYVNDQKSAVLKAQLSIKKGFQALELDLAEESDSKLLLSRYKEGAVLISEESIAFGIDKKTTELIKFSFELANLKTSANVGKTAIRLKAQQYEADLTELIDQLAKDAPFDPDLNLVDLKQEAADALDEAAEGGVIGAKEAAIRKLAFNRRVDIDRVERMIQDDPARALELLNETTGEEGGGWANFNGLQEKDRIQMTKEADSEINRRQRQAAVGLPEVIKDYLNSVRDTGAGNTDVPDRVEAVSTPQEFERFKRREGLALEVHSVRKQIQFDPPLKMIAAVEELRPESGQEGFAEQAEAYRNALTAMEKILKARKDDPSGYFAPVTAKGGTPEEMITNSLAAQEAGGVPFFDQRPIGKASSEFAVSAWAAGTTDNRYPQIRALLDLSGRHAGIVMAQLIEDGLPEYTTGYTKWTARVAGIADEAMASKKSDLMDLVGDKAKQIVDEAKEELEEFRQSMMPGTSSAQTGFQDVNENVALLLASRGVSNPAEVAARELWGGYKYVGRLRIPEEMFNTSQFDLKLDIKMRDLRKTEIAAQNPFHFAAGIPANVAKEDLSNVIFFAGGRDQHAYAYLRDQPVLSRTRYDAARAAGKSHDDAALAARIGFAFADVAATKFDDSTITGAAEILEKQEITDSVVLRQLVVKATAAKVRPRRMTPRETEKFNLTEKTRRDKAALDFLRQLRRQQEEGRQ